jgi:hypothetical protein
MDELRKIHGPELQDPRSVPFNVDPAYVEGRDTPHGRQVNVLIIVLSYELSVCNTNFYCRLALGDGVVSCGSYAQQWCSSSTSLSSRSHQSQDEQNEERFQCQEELIQNLMQR